jgi:hypothetical protein|tara:strand:+ start:28759 stop:29031 length:273 start_codon:yes stop_codon:yes gene_type:complete
MLVKIFGLIDLIGGIILTFSLQNSIGIPILIFLGLALIIKSSIGRWKEIAGWMDLFAGVVFLLVSVISIPDFVGIIAGILILQKGIVGFM